VYPVRDIVTGKSPNFVLINQKNFKLSNDLDEILFSIFNEFGPWSANAAVDSVSSRISIFKLFPL
jgi:hypothetical protein